MNNCLVILRVNNKYLLLICNKTNLKLIQLFLSVIVAVYVIFNCCIKYVSTYFLIVHLSIIKAKSLFKSIILKHLEQISSRLVQSWKKSYWFLRAFLPFPGKQCSNVSYCVGKFCYKTSFVSAKKCTTEQPNMFLKSSKKVVTLNKI